MGMSRRCKVHDELGLHSQRWPDRFSERGFSLSPRFTVYLPPLQINTIPDQDEYSIVLYEGRREGMSVIKAGDRGQGDRGDLGSTQE